MANLVYINLVKYSRKMYKGNKQNQVDVLIKNLILDKIDCCEVLNQLCPMSILHMCYT